MKKIWWYFAEILIWFDQGINVIFAPLLNLMVTPPGARFGSADETISSVFGKNVKTGTCKVCTWICRWILHPIESNHCVKYIESDEGPRE